MAMAGFRITRECVCVLLALLGILACQALAAAPDSWQVIVQNSGVCTMHAALMHTNKVIIYDRTDFGPSQMPFNDGYCRENPRDLKLKRDCTAHSIYLDLATNKVHPLKVFSDPWCSSGAHLADGTLLQTGGWNDGGNVTRTIGPNAGDDWLEHPHEPDILTGNRWYSSNHILPDNRVIIVGGRRMFSYEFHPKASGEKGFMLPFLRATNTPGAEHNLYPFVFLNPDGNLFLFGNQDAILLDYNNNKVVRQYPRIPDGPRNYPASGAAVLLPLQAADGFTKAEVLICGGAPKDAFSNTGKKIYDQALQSCGRMEITAADPVWTMVNMPMPRVMSDMLILPTAEVIILNGARNGTAGWRAAKEPILTPVTYDPPRNRFFTWRPSTIPRMYHSVALVLPDGKIFVAGSNTNPGYEFKNVEFPTEMRIEKYSPYYTAKQYNGRRPKVVAAPKAVNFGTSFQVSFELSQAPGKLKFHLYAPSFTTHNFSMNQRMLVLKADAVVPDPAIPNLYSVTLYAPPSAVVAPASWYLLSVVNLGTPSTSVWVQITKIVESPAPVADPPSPPADPSAEVPAPVADPPSPPADPSAEVPAPSV